MGGSLKLSGIIVLVLMLRPLTNGMEMAKAAEERKYELVNRKMKELAPACDEKECQVECENDGYWKGRCFREACVCFESKKGGEAAEAEERQMKYDRPSCTSDPPCVAACKKDGFCGGDCSEYICFCFTNCSSTAHHTHYPPQLS